MRRLLLLALTLAGILLLAELLWAAQAHATAYYVSQSTGNDANACTSTGAPCATITHGLSLLTNGVGGTVCVIDSSTYTAATEGTTGGGDYVVNIGISGASGQYLELVTGQFCGQPTSTPTISSWNSGTSAQFRAIDASTRGSTANAYIRIKGFTLYGGDDKAGVAAVCTGPSTGNNGYFFGFSPTSQPFYICNHQGIYLSGHHYDVEYNTAYAFGSAGIGGAPPNTGAAASSTNNLDYITLAYNVAHDNATWSPAGGSGASLYLPANFDTGAGQTCPGDTSGNTYHNCFVGNWFYANTSIIAETGYTWPQDANGFLLDDGTHDQAPSLGAAYTGTTLFANNIAAGNSGVGIGSFQTCCVTFAYNTAYGNNQVPLANRTSADPLSQFELGASSYGTNSISNFKFYNNIAWSTAATIYPISCYQFGSGSQCGSLSYDYNAQFGGGGRTLSGTHDVTANPGLVSPGATSAANFHPSSLGSPVVGTANSTDYALNIDFYGTARPQGSNYDIGAAQFGSATSGGRGGMFLRIAGTLPPPAPPSYTGLGDLSTAATWKGYWGLRAYSSATRGSNLIIACLPSDTACANIASSATTGLLSATAVTALGCSNNCTIKEFYDQTGTGNNFIQNTEALRATLTTSCTGMTGPFCFATTDTVQYTATFTTYASPFSLTSTMAGTGGATYEGPMLTSSVAGFFWRQGEAGPPAKNFQAFTNAFGDHIESANAAPVNTFHSVQFSVGSGSSTGRISDNNTQTTASMTGGNLGPVFYMNNDGGGNDLTANLTYVAFGTGALTSGDMTAVSALDHTLDGF